MSDYFDPVETIDGDFASGLLLLCDHASNALPKEYGDLGLSPEIYQRHIAYDIGARAVTVELSQRLGVPAVMSTFSRLLVDPNRGEDDPTVIMRLSDGVVIPGNHPIAPQEVEQRLARYHRPYHQAIDDALDACFAAGTVPAVFSIHSFTAAWKGIARPWEIAFLWDKDPRFTKPLVDLLRADPAIVVGDNQPYDGALRNDTMYRHCTSRGLAHTLVEFRQDLIDDQNDVVAWCDRLSPMLEKVNALAEMHETRHFGSRTGEVALRENPPLRSAANV